MSNDISDQKFTRDAYCDLKSIFAFPQFGLAVSWQHCS